MPGMSGAVSCSQRHSAIPDAGAAEVSAITRRTSQVYQFAWDRFGEPSVEKSWEKDSDRLLSIITPCAFTSG